MAVSHDGEHTHILNGRLLRSKRQYQNKLKARLQARIDVKKKGSRRRKHMLYDVPVVGPRTIAVMRETGATALSIDAGRTLSLDRVEMLRAADAGGISIVAHMN